MSREEKKKATRRRIIEAAVELFGRQGFEETTVRDIAARAEVAKGTFFNYFESKEDMLLELQGVLLMREIESKRASDGPILPRLRDSLLAYARTFPLSAQVTRAVLQGVCGSAKVGGAQAEKRQEFIRYLTPILEKAREMGEIRRDLPAGQIARMAVQSYYGVLLFWVLEGGEANLEEQMARQFAAFIDGIRAEAASGAGGGAGQS